MNWDAVGALGELLGSIAVLVSIVYLALQIRQNSELARVDAFRDMQKLWSDLRGQALLPENHAVLTRGLEGLANLNEEEKARFIKLMGDEFAFFDTMMLMDRKGFLEPEYRVVENFGNHFRRYLQHLGVQEFWVIIESGTSPYLIDWVNENMGKDDLG